MLGSRAVNAELRKSLGLSLKKIEMHLITGGDLGEKTFMECCRHLWKANGVELLEPFVEAAFNKLPEKRSVLFQRMPTIVYIAQNKEIED